MDCSTPSFPVHHQLPELAQTHGHWVSDAILLSLPLLFLSPPAFNLSQHQHFFQWISSSHKVAKVLVSASASVFPMNIQDWFPLGLTAWISLLSKELSRDLSNATVQKHHFFGAQLSFFLFFFSFIFISWRLITLQYYSGFLYIDMNHPWIYMYSPS